MSIIVSSPGKIHLLGEHAVVYGKPALLAALDKRLYVQIQNPKSPASAGSRLRRDKTKNQDEIIINTNEDKTLVLEAISIFKKAYSIDALPPLEIKITSQIPACCGLGSSAALSSAVIGALMKGVKNIWNPVKINELSYEVEKKAHGNPSGADNTTVVFGGLVWFRREFEFLKSIWSLPVKSYKIPKFLLINSGRPVESTREMVEAVAEMKSKKKKYIDTLLSDQELQTKKLLLSLKTDDINSMCQAISKGERNLQNLGIVGDKAREIIDDIEKINGVSKVCGAGGKKEGSGILLCYHDNLSTIVKIAAKYNLPYWSSVLGMDGIRIERFNI